ncbi:helix-turn-helix domain-containing protein [Haloquadratum walsbyi]|uniref:Putative DNA binding protein n=1 Tax=Haloquadratum walsbyi J07HQW2 TaxID=1238425 RepID=U1PQJ9_9EURY|nr:helix-turn-helix domain-containing protein [Haloquadratum walsbyi]ERG96042.1 MAG: putative DNA binding protein [Haloquadratum walsbyi J07HQW2]
MHLQSRETIERESIDAQVFSELDEYQRQAIETATRMEFFSRPQDAPAGDVADALDVGRTTFSRRLKNAQTTVFNRMPDQQSDTGSVDD